MTHVDIPKLLKNAKTIAVFGLSAKPHRASYEVASYLQQNGYRILPINPNEAGNLILSEFCYGSLPEAAKASGLAIDIVVCFRKSADIPEILEQAIVVNAACLWMQLDICNEACANRAEHEGMLVVMDKCLKIEHARCQASAAHIPHI
ncbi:CoA-binding protein [Undibacterium sp. Ren11W]|uniref:CoA-binding protein n=1 Tax=Undibacterium sp. Ren11W TaxID=3413045 RepID=UPI003BF35AAA